MPRLRAHPSPRAAGALLLIDADVPDPFDTPGETEWLVATGEGGYALGTASGIPTRRYHGNLVVALPPPLGRTMVWPRSEEVLRTATGDEVALTQSWFEPGVLVPEVAAVPTAFTCAWQGFPTWTFEIGEHRVQRRLVVGARSAGLEFRLLDGPPCEVLVRPLLTWRSHHHVRRHPDVTGVTVMWSGEVDDDVRHVYRNALLPTERARGYAHVEDLVAPVRVRFRLDKGPGQLWVKLTAATDDDPDPSPEEDPVARARSAFVIRRPDGRSGIVAGYPWFTEWGRDTMIALPGLLLPHDPPRVREVLGAWCDRLDRGLLPCQLHDSGSGPLHTNTADASLRMLQAMAALHEVSPDLVDAPLRAAADSVVEAYDSGTDHGIFVDDDGLLVAGAEGEALTWMDAITSDGPVTPRRGKAVDLNALYVQGVRFAAELASTAGASDRARVLTNRARRCADAMAERFPDGGDGWLLDVVDSVDTVSPEPLRPNLLVALATPDIPWPGQVAERSLAMVEERLLTPYGLRTLDPRHPDYVPRYGGDQPTRDRAYHQGTVWPWLIGSYVDAVLQVRGDDESVRATLAERLATLKRDLDAHGSLYEVYDGDPPHRPGGCPAQAWSVSEVLRAWQRVAPPVQ